MHSFLNSKFHWTAELLLAICYNWIVYVFRLNVPPETCNKSAELHFIYDIILWLCGGVVVHIISLQWQCSRAATFGPFCYAPHSHDLDNNTVLNIRGMDMMSAFVLVAIPYKWMFAFICIYNCIALLNVLKYSRIKTKFHILKIFVKYISKNTKQESESPYLGILYLVWTLLGSTFPQHKYT